jgi:hypothetical protein
MTHLEALTEIKPKFPPKVQQIWDDCGTYVTSMEAEQGAKEIEFFVEALLETVLESHRYVGGSMTLEEVLVEGGYLNYERK